jgi:hypothetical protein
VFAYDFELKAPVRVEQPLRGFGLSMHEDHSGAFGTCDP